VIVFIVKSAYGYDPPRIEGVFDSKEKAEAFMESLTNPDYSGFQCWFEAHKVQ
jgi:hypothetical protein